MRRFLQVSTRGVATIVGPAGSRSAASLESAHVLGLRLDQRRAFSLSQLQYAKKKDPSATFMDGGNTTSKNPAASNKHTGASNKNTGNNNRDHEKKKGLWEMASEKLSSVGAKTRSAATRALDEAGGHKTDQHSMSNPGHTGSQTSHTGHAGSSTGHTGSSTGHSGAAPSQGITNLGHHGGSTGQGGGSMAGHSGSSNLGHSGGHGGSSNLGHHGGSGQGHTGGGSSNSGQIGGNTGHSGSNLGHSSGSQGHGGSGLGHSGSNPQMGHSVGSQSGHAFDALSGDHSSGKRSASSPRQGSSSVDHHGHQDHHEPEHKRRSSGHEAGHSGASKSTARGGSARKPADHRAASSVRHDQTKMRFVMDLGDGQVARIDYKPTGKDRIELYHTEVPEALRGRGIGKALAKGALEAASKAHLKLRVTCDYLEDYLRRHSDSKYKHLFD